MDGFYFFKYGNKDVCERVLHEGPWLFDERLIILKRWESLELETDLLSSIPAWVRFPSLHLKFWSQKILSKATNIIGKPLYMDNATVTRGKFVFAHCFIEILQLASYLKWSV